MCLDPRSLNKAILREHYPTKSIEEIAAKLSDAKVFSTLDASSGFWQVKLDDISANLCTFNSPFGRYKFLRLPFGINSTPEVFQRKMTQTFEDIDGCETIADDILIWGRDTQEHDQRLRQVLQRSRDVNLKLNEEKSKIGTTEVSFIGHLLTSKGVKPDPKKVQAITDMQAPKDTTKLQRFLGMVSYLAKFIGNLSDVLQPLRELLQKDVEWHWEEKHEHAFTEIKRRVTNEQLLQHSNVKKPVTLSVDSSSYCLGA